MRILYLSLFLLLIFQTVLLSAQTKQLTVEQIVNLHTKAVGGEAAIEKMQSIEIALDMIEPTFHVSGIYKANRNRRMRIDIYSEGKRVYTEAYDGKTGWQMGDDSLPKDSSAQATEALLHGILLPGKLFGLHEQKKIGNHLELEGRQQIDNTNFYVLKLSFPDGYVVQLYLNPQNWLIERTRDIKAFHPDVDPAKADMENRVSDFRRVDGVLRAFRTEQIDLKTGKVVGTYTTTSFRGNPEISDSVYQKPPSK